VLGDGHAWDDLEEFAAAEEGTGGEFSGAALAFGCGGGETDEGFGFAFDGDFREGWGRGGIGGVEGGGEREEGD
jgi:hypothetical protein